MTPEAQRIAIAEKCGWTEIGKGKFSFKLFGNHTEKGEDQELPDYLTDLNAMHGAEKVFLINKLGPAYQRWLDELNMANLEFGVYHATAAQRAEAFLRTLGLYQ